MKSINYLILCVFALTIAVSSCKKDVKTNSEILTSTTWKYSSLLFNNVDTPLSDCSMDDNIKFATDGTFTTTYGTLHCDPNETTLTGTWSLSTDGKTITLNGKSSTIVITESKLVLTVITGNITIVWTFIPR